MLLAHSKIAKVVIIRPGALGDVLAVRGVVRFFADAFPGCAVCLVAPGERGRFFCREGWADRAFDWERAAFSWMFTHGADDPPPALRAVFAGSDIVISYLDFADHEEMARYERNLERLVPAAGKVYCPSRPPDGHHHGVRIGEWLRGAAKDFCVRYGLLAGDSPATASGVDARIAIAGGARAPASDSYYVMHPGSGSRSKNWPVERFRELAALLAEAAGQGGDPAFARLVVTAGEADGDLGRLLAAAVPGAVLLDDLALEELAAVLAGAAYFIGNDSGVSHLAAAVARSDGSRPRVAAIFGPSDAEIWGPPDALILEAGADMKALSAAAAHAAIVERWP